ncbi:cytosine-specific methyltransferase [Sporosarcina sp. NCCP-2716]|uniref:DNA (cytosine-5-)-methyltransferase n=1 Tax=Sporosarcina sp. NCCP-2716 TaxID=2943679 RepID=UPI00203E8F44|nr:DNA (cytosine-5-)-methyltransferase [Sporosarcina sp. NCCP-2716]GKV69766.1 cytosine-specific methyltransferase [Sporosarcina sp. NCCP-2716]
MSDSKKISVIELFAGVGGFRLGLEQANADLFEVIWGNQWEPSRKAQDAFDCYTRNFENGIHSNEDIATVPDEVFQDIAPDMVVGGFPCQDYSVARTLSGGKGIQGKKGVLFWEIKRILENGSPKYVLLENVDRLLKSPSTQRGRDFAVMLATFRDLGYTVEWRVLNAAEYGLAQRRRRVFIFAYKNGIPFETEQRDIDGNTILFEKGFFAKPFPVEETPYKERVNHTKLPLDIVDISDEFSFAFHTAGIMRDGEILTAQPVPIPHSPTPLSEIILPEEAVDEKFYLSPEAEAKFKYLRGPKKIERVSADGHKYNFSEGGMSLVDELDKPGRTMLTSEGSINRSTHIVQLGDRKRMLTPIECERLNGFPDNWTAGMSDRMRYFCMGNALVVTLIERMGKRIEEIESLESEYSPAIQMNLTF